MKMDIQDIQIYFHAYPICFHPKGGNWKETEKRISEISEFVSMRIRSVCILNYGPVCVSAHNKI